MHCSNLSLRHRWRVSLHGAAGLLLLAVAGCADFGGSGSPLIDPVSEVDGPARLLVVSGDKVTLEDGSLNQFLQAPGKNVVVSFGATWCPPCRMLAPELTRVAESRSQDVIVVKVNVDRAPELAAHFQVGLLPDIRVFQEGKAIASLVGFHKADAILEKLNGGQTDH